MTQVVVHNLQHQPPAGLLRPPAGRHDPKVHEGRADGRNPHLTSLPGVPAARGLLGRHLGHEAIHRDLPPDKGLPPYEVRALEPQLHRILFLSPGPVLSLGLPRRRLHGARIIRLRVEFREGLHLHRLVRNGLVQGPGRVVDALGIHLAVGGTERGRQEFFESVDARRKLGHVQGHRARASDARSGILLLGEIPQPPLLYFVLNFFHVQPPRPRPLQHLASRRLEAGGVRALGHGRGPNGGLIPVLAGSR